MAKSFARVGVVCYGPIARGGEAGLGGTGPSNQGRVAQKMRAVSSAHRAQPGSPLPRGLESSVHLRAPGGDSDGFDTITTKLDRNSQYMSWHLTWTLARTCQRTLPPNPIRTVSHRFSTVREGCAAAAFRRNLGRAPTLSRDGGSQGLLLTPISRARLHRRQAGLKSGTKSLMSGATPPTWMRACVVLADQSDP